MKYIWEEKDLVCGSYICRGDIDDEPASGTTSYLCTVTYQLGYISGSAYDMCMISICDGLVVKFEEDEGEANSKDKLLEHLNNDNLGFRPLTKAQVFKRLDYLLGE